LLEETVTQIRGFIPPTRRPNALGIHSLDYFSLAVPDLGEAQRFYQNFGLDVRERGEALHLGTDGFEHSWGILSEGSRKQLQHLSFGAFADDMDRFRARLDQLDIERLDPPPGFESNGLWFRDCNGVLIEIKVAGKTSPNAKSEVSNPSSPPGVQGAFMRGQAPLVRPRRLAHILIFTRDIPRTIRFYQDVLGLRLSDEAGGVVAFMHGIHGSDHHLIALAKSDAPGFHHASWDVGSIQEIGLGAMQMADKGFSAGWGLGRHVLGSNYFHYVRDPWGSYAEYSSDIDYVPVEMDWQEGHHAPENSLYLWGPEPPKDFVINYESPTMEQLAKAEAVTRPVGRT